MPNSSTRVDARRQSVVDHQTKTTLSLKTVWDVLAVRFLLGAAVLVYRHDFISNVINRYNSSTTAAGYVTSFASIVGTATGFFVGIVSDRYYGNDSERLLSHSALLETVSLVVLCISPNIFVLALSQAALSVSCTVGRVAAVDVTSQRGGRQHTGALMGTGATVLSVSRMLSPMIGGLSQEISEDYGPIVSSILLAAVGTLIMFATSRRVKQHLN
jgi:predicted MFS family arabinose efflux permease